jgi:16S rRNA processing protein RimM
MKPGQFLAVSADQAGSPPVGEPAFLAVGKLRRPHGLHGEMLLEVWSDFPERLAPGLTVYAGAAHQPLRLAGCRWHGEALLLKFEGLDTPEASGAWRNQVVFVPAADRPPLPEGDFYHHQLLGLGVVNENGESLGVVCDILETGANDVLVIRPEGGPQRLLPLINEVVLQVDLEAGLLRVHLLEGL